MTLEAFDCENSKESEKQDNQSVRCVSDRYALQLEWAVIDKGRDRIKNEEPNGEKRK